MARNTATDLPGLGATWVSLGLPSVQPQLSPVRQGLPDTLREPSLELLSPQCGAPWELALFGSGGNGGAHQDTDERILDTGPLPGGGGREGNWKDGHLQALEGVALRNAQKYLAGQTFSLAPEGRSRDPFSYSHVAPCRTQTLCC